MKPVTVSEVNAVMEELDDAELAVTASEIWIGLRSKARQYLI